MNNYSFSNNGHNGNGRYATNGSEGHSILRTEHVSKVYTDGQVNALMDVSLEINRGEYVSIMGPSGSGKSTLLNMLGMLDRPTSGEIYLDGQAVSRVKNLDGLRAQKIGFVFQSFYLLPVLSAIENVQIPMFETKMPKAVWKQKAVDLLRLVNLEHRANHLPLQLSVGERQRVAIARALANDPVMLLADEPTGNLDSKSADSVFELFDKLHEERGMTIVLITHSEELGRRAPRIIRMQDGQKQSDNLTAYDHYDPTIGRGPRPKSVLPPFAIPDRS